MILIQSINTILKSKIEAEIGCTLISQNTQKSSLPENKITMIIITVKFPRQVLKMIKGQFLERVERNLQTQGGIAHFLS